MIKKRRFPVQAAVNHLGRRSRLGSRFQEPEPNQWSENASLHRTGTEIPLRLQYTDHGRCAKARKCLSREPIVCRCRKRPQNDTHLGQRPRIERISIEIGEVQAPEGDMEKDSLQGSMLFRREYPPTQRRPAAAFHDATGGASPIASGCE
jgi:hypothetical protein